MKITNIRAQILKPTEELFRWKEQWPARQIGMILLRLESDEGPTGHCLTWLLGPGALEDAMPRLRDTLIGRDPHDIEAISAELTDNLQQPTPVASTVDIALWDLVGKLHDQPVYKLLGAARDRMLAYASTLMYETVDEYVQLALECRDQGFKAFKLHAFGVPDKDIEVCRAVKAAVGDSMLLMLDPVNAYDRIGAFKVGAVLEELDFYWYEAPLPDTDLNGLADLTRTFSISITAVESVAGGLRQIPPYLVNHAVDSVRSVGDWIGGISAMRKCAALCEAFNVKYEPHSYGTTLIQAAHFHVMLAINNCDLVELPVPRGILDHGMADVMWIDGDGYVDAPTKPGLGYDLDEDAIADLTVREIGISSTSASHWH